MSDPKSLKERIEELYNSTPEPLDGVVEIKQLQKKLEEKFKNSGKSSKTKEGKLYQEAISNVEKAYFSLSRASESSINFGSSSVLKLQQDSVEFLAQNYGDEKLADILSLCSKLILDFKNQNVAEKKRSSNKNNEGSFDPKKDAAVLAAVEKAIKWSSEGENAVTIKEKLLIALKDEAVQHVKYRNDKKGNKKASIFVDGKPMNFDSAKLAAGRALKLDSEAPEGKYKKSGKRYLLK